MSPGLCEICGKPSSVHLTEVVSRPDGSSTKVEHHFCRDHVPLDIPPTTPAEELKVVERMLLKLDARDMDASLKAEFGRELEELALDIAAGRRRLGDA